MQCCETLDENRSWAHNLKPSDNPTNEGFVTWMLRQAGAGALRVPLDWRPRRLEHWGEKLNLYSYRDMKYGEDAIRAFAGVLQRLETIYPEGFFWGLPIEDFDWALTWRSQVAPMRRLGFPSWSWSGWKGPLFFGQPRDLTQTRRFPVHLNVSGLKNGTLTTIFRSPTTTDDDEDGVRIIIRNDPIDQAVNIVVAQVLGPVDVQHLTDHHGAILIDAVALSFIPDFSNPRTGTYQAGQAELFAFDVSGIRCIIRIFSTDENIPGKWVDTRWSLDEARCKEWTCILVARDHESGFISHHLVAVEADPESKIMRRRTVFELLVPLDELDILTAFEPRRVKLILA